MYSISSYGEMIADHVRIDRYARALRQAIKPGSVVADIGTGIGFFAVLACKFGARRVYAIEPNDAIQLARDIAASNGCADRIEFIQEMSTKVVLPERADVIISDLRGMLPMFQHHIPSIVDARQRLLAPGGQLIPQRDTLRAAVVEAPESYGPYTKPWDERPHGIDLAAGGRLARNAWRSYRAKPEQLLLPPQSWATLEYASVTQADVSGEIEWIVERPGTAHGLLVWFDGLLAEGAHFSNAPGEPELIYGRTFFPWSQPVALEPGDTVWVALAADLVGENYVWRWDTRIRARGQPEGTRASFQQSTFFGEPLSPAQLRRESSDHVPTLTEEGQIDSFMLSLMNGERSLASIAEQAATRFPHRFPDWHRALTRAGMLSVTYGRRSVTPESVPE
jgi:protein arginine N-methyltransferase 1